MLARNFAGSNQLIDAEIDQYRVRQMKLEAGSQSECMNFSLLLVIVQNECGKINYSII